jgi:hypothetical protein
MDHAAQYLGSENSSSHDRVYPSSGHIRSDPTATAQDRTRHKYTDSKYALCPHYVPSIADKQCLPDNTSM